MSIKDELLLGLSVTKLKQLAKENGVPLVEIRSSFSDFRDRPFPITDKVEIMRVMSKSSKITTQKIKDFIDKGAKKGKKKDDSTQIKRRPLTAYEKDQIITRQKNKCAATGCKNHFSSKIIPHYDHKKPLALGGKDEISNIQALCPNHHAEKTRKDRHDIAEKKKKDKAKKVVKP